MYSVLTLFFLIGVLLIAAGFLGRAGTEAFPEVSANLASSLALLVVYAFIFLSFSSFSELFTVFEGICGGIPYLDKIADYGSLRGLFEMDPFSAAISFLDSVILSATISALDLLPLTQGSAAGKGNIMVGLFTRVVLALISLCLLNFVIKETAAYHWVVSLTGLLISAVSLGTLPLTLVPLLRRYRPSGLELSSVVLLLSRSRLVGILRDAFFKAIVYVFGLYLLEEKFGSVADSLSFFSVLAVAFGPLLVILIGIVLLLKSVK